LSIRYYVTIIKNNDDERGEHYVQKH
jgi:hypothetical protein